MDVVFAHLTAIPVARLSSHASTLMHASVRSHPTSDIAESKEAERGSPAFTGAIDIRKKLCSRENCAVHACVLMTNHVHLLLTPQACGQVASSPFDVCCVITFAPRRIVMSRMACDYFDVVL